MTIFWCGARFSRGSWGCGGEFVIEFLSEAGTASRFHERSGCGLRGQIYRDFGGIRPWSGVGRRVILATAEGKKWMTRCREDCHGRPGLPGVLSPADRHLASPIRGPPVGLRRASAVVGGRRSLCRQLRDGSPLDPPVPHAV